MKTIRYSILFFFLLGISLAPTSPNENTSSDLALAGGNPAAVELCKRILPERPQFKNLGQCVKLFVVCGDVDTQAPNYPVCVCEIIKSKGLMDVFGFKNTGQCVSSAAGNRR